MMTTLEMHPVEQRLWVNVLSAAGLLRTDGERNGDRGKCIDIIPHRMIDNYTNTIKHIAHMALCTYTLSPCWLNAMAGVLTTVYFSVLMRNNEVQLFFV